jgi:hypothetical protein
VTLSRRILLIAATLLFAWGVVVQVTGGVDVRVAGIAIRSRDPFRALLTSLLIFLFVAVVHRRYFIEVLDAIGARLRAWSAGLVLVVALALAAHGIVFGSFGVGGADAYGYVNQAYDWASGALPRALPLPLALPFETSDQMQTPLGYRVGVTPHTMVPTYAPGLPLIMAVALLLGGCGPYFVVPFFAVLFVWFTYRLGTLAGGRAVGVVAALVLVTSPVVLYQVLWPMSDIPAGALWTAAFVYALGGSRKSAVAAGLWAAVGLLVRPNLLFVPAAPLLLIASVTTGRERWIRGALFTLPLVPVAVLVAVLNTMWYGSPSNSGYGAARDLYLLGNVWPNVKLYFSWFRESQSAWMLLALLPFVPPFSRHVQRRVLASCALVFLVTFASYVSYSQFEVWWYLRFLMPAFGALAVMIAAGLACIARAVPQPFGRMAAGIALYLMIVTTVSFAADKNVFGRLRAGERRYVDVGEFAADALPPNAALFSTQHSGSLRFYSGRVTLRFDWVQKEWAPTVPAVVERAGYHPYLVVDDWEIAQVRSQFGFAPDAPLPWPIVARMRELGGLTVFDMATAPGAVTPIALEPSSRYWCAPRHRPVI